MGSLPHCRDAAGIPRVLRLVQNTTVPSRVTTQHLRSNGFSEVHAPQLVGVLRGMKFIDQGGQPTEWWRQFRNGEPGGRVLETAVRGAYAPLFEALGEPTTHTDDQLAAAIRSRTSFNEGHVREAVQCFRAFCAAAESDPPATLEATSEAKVRPTMVREVANLSAISATELVAAQGALHHRLFRAAHVSAWNGYVAQALMCMASDDFRALRSVRPKWDELSIPDVAMRTAGRTLIDLLVELKLIGGDQEFRLAELMQRRNDCAHPTAFNPSYEETRNYLDEISEAALELARLPIH